MLPLKRGRGRNVAHSFSCISRVCRICVLLTHLLSLTNFCSGTDISAEVPSIGVKVCVTVDLSSGQRLSPFGGDIFRGSRSPNMRPKKKEVVDFGAYKSALTVNISKTVSRSVTCHQNAPFPSEFFFWHSPSQTHPHWGGEPLSRPHPSWPPPMKISGYTLETCFRLWRFDRT